MNWLCKIGIHRWFGWIDRDQWGRTCKKCGKQEYLPS